MIGFLQYIGRFLILMVCIGGMQCWGQKADQWNYFDPTRVTKLGCRAEQVRHDPAGIGSVHEEVVWEAEAFADRMNEPRWSKILAMFPSNLKGRHAAEKACSQWMDEASKRVHHAAPTPTLVKR